MSELQQFLARIPADYQQVLAHRLHDPQWIKLLESIQRYENASRASNPNMIFPSYEHVFRALQLTPLDQVKVLILGQDPYHTPGLAQGLAFSIPQNIRLGSRDFPSSLRNINKALIIEGFKPLLHGDLSLWAKQGVLLLNASLTVEAKRPNSHLHFGWNLFTDALIVDLLNVGNDLAVLLWGSFAEKKSTLFPAQRPHLILKSSHPSGLSVYKTNTPFILPGDKATCNHFSQVNLWLKSQGKTPIDW